QIQALEQQLCASPEGLRYFARYARMHTDLRLEVRSHQLSARVLEQIEQLVAEDGVRTAPAAGADMLRVPFTPAVRRVVWALAAVPAAILVVTLVARPFRKPASTASVRPPEPGTNAERFVRAIVPPPVVVPRTFRLTFDHDTDSPIHDANGLGTGLSARLP